MPERVKSWKAWAVVVEDRWIAQSDAYGKLEIASRAHALAMLVPQRERVVRVTITVDEKKRRKVKRG